LKTAIANVNLAHELIDIGHLRAAQALCDEVAPDLKDDERLLSAQSRLQSVPTEEAARGAKLLRESRVVREFEQAWARAPDCCGPQSSPWRRSQSFTSATSSSAF
jgi:hypothetical protein